MGNASQKLQVRAGRAELNLRHAPGGRRARIRISTAG